MAAPKKNTREKFEEKTQAATVDETVPVVKTDETPDVTTPSEAEKLLDRETTIPADMSKLSPIQQEISGYVTTAKKEPPRITDVSELFTRIEMAIPKGVSRGPEYDYCWLSIDELSSISGTKWEIVNRNNHSHAPRRMFDRAGAILYKGQNILAFCYKESRDLEQAAIIAAFNKKTNKITAVQDKASEKEVRNIPITHAGGVVTGGLIDSYVDPDKFPAEVDDF